MGVHDHSDEAPAYDDIYQDHPVNQNAPSGSSRAYARVPQTDNSDDPQSQAESGHGHGHAQPETPQLPVPRDEAAFGGPAALQMLDSSQPCRHCGECERIMMGREKRAADMLCCRWTAYTFMAAFFSGAVVGIVWLTH